MDHSNHHAVTEPPHQNTEHHTGHHHEGSHTAFFNTDADAPILFSNWNINTKTGLFLACLCTIALGILYQGIKCLRQYVHRDFSLTRHSIRNREHILQTLLYLIQMIGSYILMLIIMTFNVWVFLATVGGLGLGYFLCGWKTPMPSQSRCHRDALKQNGRQEQEELLGQEVEMSRETVL